MSENRQLIDVTKRIINDALANTHTATIARVSAVSENTISCDPVIDRIVDGEALRLPTFVDVPPVFLQGGSSYLAHPVEVGDYCLLLFAERCFDRWYNGDDFRPPLELRMHDYSDGFALVGVNPLAQALTIPQETTMTGVTRMGVEDPVDRMALAQKVLDELVRIKSELDAFKATFDSHTHGGVSSGQSTTAQPGTPFPAPAEPSSVESQYVKAD